MARLYGEALVKVKGARRRMSSGEPRGGVNGGEEAQTLTYFGDEELR